MRRGPTNNPWIALGWPPSNFVDQGFIAAWDGKAENVSVDELAGMIGKAHEWVSVVPNT